MNDLSQSVEHGSTTMVDWMTDKLWTKKRHRIRWTGNKRLEFIVLKHFFFFSPFFFFTISSESGRFRIQSCEDKWLHVTFATSIDGWLQSAGICFLTKTGRKLPNNSMKRRERREEKKTHKKVFKQGAPCWIKEKWQQQQRQNDTKISILTLSTR